MLRTVVFLYLHPRYAYLACLATRDIAESDTAPSAMHQRGMSSITYGDATRGDISRTAFAASEVRRRCIASLRLPRAARYEVHHRR